MKFTSEDLMKAMGLKVGDRVACLDSRYIFMVREYRGNVYLECENADLETQFMHYLLNVEFEILPAPKRVGDLKCGYMEKNCVECPCPLKVVFKALKEGCHIKDEGYFECPDIYFHSLEMEFVIGWANKDNMGYELLKDYGKTWWLKGEKKHEED